MIGVRMGEEVDASEGCGGDKLDLPPESLRAAAGSESALAKNLKKEAVGSSLI